jgi:hypothetical protein
MIIFIQTTLFVQQIVFLLMFWEFMMTLSLNTLKFSIMEKRVTML